jgi:DNA polymerase sigma
VCSVSVGLIHGADMKLLICRYEPLQSLHHDTHNILIFESLFALSHIVYACMNENIQDPSSGMDCDISVMNPLAVRNTELLRAYSQADPRVRKVSAVYSSGCTACHHYTWKY